MYMALKTDLLSFSGSTSGSISITNLSHDENP